MSTAIKPKHIGLNISQIRELRGKKQEALAFAIGISQQSISNIEGSENVDEEKLLKGNSFYKNYIDCKKRLVGLFLVLKEVQKSKQIHHERNISFKLRKNCFTSKR